MLQINGKSKQVGVITILLMQVNKYVDSGIINYIQEICTTIFPI